MRLTIILAGIVSVIAGVVIGGSISTVQQSAIPGAGLLAGVLGLITLLAIACPAALGAAWIVDRFQRVDRRRTGCV